MANKVSFKNEDEIDISSWIKTENLLLAEPTYKKY
jgi:hypothetical protein